jgi:hypothetical protein
MTHYDILSLFCLSTVQYNLTLSGICLENHPAQFSKFATSPMVLEVIHITVQAI